MANRKNTASPPAAKLTPQQLIQIDRDRRALTCQVEIEAVLKRHNCRLQAQVTITGDRTASRTIIVALDPPEPGSG